MDLIQKTCGTEEYVKVYQQVQEHISCVRQSRRTSRAIQKIVDPKASAIRRLQKNEMKKNSKKRKANALLAYRGKRRNMES